MKSVSFRCRDFLVSEEGLVFSVVAYVHPKGRVIAFLRFIPQGGVLVKVGSTEESFRFLEKNFPEYIFNSDVSDVRLQAVPLEKIKESIRPDEFLKKLYKQADKDEYPDDICSLAELLSKRSGVPLSKFGVTGSVLVGAYSPSSDVDLVVYGARNFEKVRLVLAECEPPLERPSDDVLRGMYERRFPVSQELSFSEFSFHELRKHTSSVFAGRRFHILYVRDSGEVSGAYGDVKSRRIGRVSLECAVLDDRQAFDYPAVYEVSGSCEFNGRFYEVTELSSFTHTYVGQVLKGEVCTTCGVLEEVSSPSGTRFRVLVGSTREACGEYIKKVG